MLHWSGIKLSQTGPRISGDNAYAEAPFSTVNYRPEFPSTGFDEPDADRTEAASFVHRYNFEHRHSGIVYLTLVQRHAGEYHMTSAARQALYAEARERKGIRFFACMTSLLCIERLAIDYAS